jgi:excisionase family DNA binding protein
VWKARQSTLRQSVGNFQNMSNANSEDQILNPAAQSPVVASAVYLNKSQVAALFQITSRTVESWMKRGLIPFVKIGKTVRFRARDIDTSVLTINARS